MPTEPENTAEESKNRASTRRGPRGAALVAIGIFLSRVLGLVRERVFAHFLGNSLAADAFKAAVRIPNLLQNLLGEGVLSASFIPAYSGLLAREKEQEARLLAWKVFRFLASVVTIVSACGVLLSPALVAVIAPGFEGEKRELATTLTRIFFPGTALLVLSAWCLGISNSHHRFFLPYAAPVVWNLVMIMTLFFFGQRSGGGELATYAAWGAVVGGFCQFAIQLPQVFNLLGRARHVGAPDQTEVDAGYRGVLKNLLPVVFGRGVVQVSAYVDSMIASLLGAGAVSALSYAQIIYLLPISLFGMSISAAELPSMSRLSTGDTGENLRRLADRLAAGSRQIAFFVVPSAVAFLLLGRELVAAAFQTGNFGAHDTAMVWSLLAALSVGLVPATLARLAASTFYALGDTRTPVRFATLRVGLSVVFAFGLALGAPRALGLSDGAGLVGLGLASAIGASTEYFFLRATLRRRLPEMPSLAPFGGMLIGLAILAAGTALLAKAIFLEPLAVRPFAQGVVVTGLFGLCYLLLCLIFRVPELRRLRRRR